MSLTKHVIFLIIKLMINFEIEEMYKQYFLSKGYICKIETSMGNRFIHFIDDFTDISIPINDISENKYFSIWCDIMKLNSFEDKRLAIIIANNINLDFLSGKIII